MSLEKHISYWGKWNFEAIEMLGHTVEYMVYDISG